MLIYVPIMFRYPPFPKSLSVPLHVFQIIGGNHQTSCDDLNWEWCARRVLKPTQPVFKPMLSCGNLKGRKTVLFKDPVGSTLQPRPFSPTSIASQNPPKKQRKPILKTQWEFYRLTPSGWIPLESRIPTLERNLPAQPSGRIDLKKTSESRGFKTQSGYPCRFLMSVVLYSHGLEAN